MAIGKAAFEELILIDPQGIEDLGIGTYDLIIVDGVTAVPVRIKLVKAHIEAYCRRRMEYKRIGLSTHITQVKVFRPIPPHYVEPMHLKDGRIYEEVPLGLIAIVPGIIERGPPPPAGGSVGQSYCFLRSYHDCIQHRPAVPDPAAIYMSDGSIVMIGIIGWHYASPIWHCIYYWPGTICYTLGICAACP